MKKVWASIARVVRRATRENLHFITETLIISCNCCFYNIPAVSNVVYY